MPEENDKKTNPNQINIELNEEIAEGIYSNLAMINHSPTEFIVDFIRLMPGVPKAKVKSRILLNPIHAKRLLRALAGNIQKYEAAHGAIKEADSGIPPVNFGGPPGKA